MQSGLLQALDPSHSVVVEACAGSGKTWLLASRIVRLLLDGVAPGEILAITFTRKAAAEIKARINEWLAGLAGWSDEDIDTFLEERGIVPSDRRQVRQRARDLLETVLTVQPGLAIHTFHAWFLRLMHAAPLKSGLPGLMLMEDSERRFEYLWQRFAAQVELDPLLASAWRDCLTDLGEIKAQRLLQTMLEHRADWLAYTDGTADPVGAVIADLASCLGIGVQDDPLADFGDESWRCALQSYADLLMPSDLSSEVDMRVKIEEALQLTQTEAAFALLSKALLTTDREPRDRFSKTGKAMEKRLGSVAAAEAVRRYNDLSARLSGIHKQLTEKSILVLNQYALPLVAAFFELWEQDKAKRGLIDYTDAEWQVFKLLRDEASAAFVQAKLDARYRHVLLDEFQDTNPIQWQILHAWLDAYAGADSRPSVFLVGDPKQSIYRFRRAEARLFATAKQFLCDHFAAYPVLYNATRRNAQALVDVINQVFTAQPAFQPFVPQDSLLAPEIAGFVEAVPLFDDRQDSEEDKPLQTGEDAEEPLRDPLKHAATEKEDRRRADEADYVASRINEMVGQVLIADPQAAGGQRLLEYADIMILCRKRTYLATYEHALRAAAVPYISASRGSLMQTLEANDVVALLCFLSMPADALALLQVLRSPMFACSNDDLLCLADDGRDLPWLQRLYDGASRSPALQRAAGLLSAWLEIAAYLPVHDLLDRIYHEGNVLARYRAVVDRTLAAAVEANLLAILQLALEQDGGRYPSLPRFLDELKRRRRLAGDEALNEGEITTTANTGRVRVLTIHAAKGLEAPLVWLIDAASHEEQKRFPALLVHWPPEAVRPDHLSLTDAKEGTTRQLFFDEERKLSERESLNLLYVAMTRARQILLISGIVSRRKSRVAKPNAYTLVKQALVQLGADHYYGQALPVRPPDDRQTDVAPAVEETTASTGKRLIVPVGKRRPLSDSSATRFGIVLHAILEKGIGNVYYDGTMDTLSRRLTGFGDNEIGAALPVVCRLLQTPGLQRFFDASSYLRAWNELEIVGPDGILRRVDRLVELENEYWVIDYKSSSADRSCIDEYRTQVGDYCKVISALFTDKPVKGGLIFADGCLIEI